MRTVLTRLFHCVVAIAVPVCASAADVSCDRVPELQQFDVAACECGSGLSKIPIVAPKGMKLIAACGYKNEEFIGVEGGFYFKGAALVTGRVKHANNSSPEGAMQFEAKDTTGDEIPFKDATLSLKFDDDSGAVQRFAAPAVSAELPCMSADARIKVNLLYVKASFDENEEGNFPKDFDVYKVGPYEPCKEQQQGAAED